MPLVGTMSVVAEALRDALASGECGKLRLGWRDMVEHVHGAIDLPWYSRYKAVLLDENGELYVVQLIYNEDVYVNAVRFNDKRVYQLQVFMEPEKPKDPVLKRIEEIEAELEALKATLTTEES